MQFPKIKQNRTELCYDLITHSLSSYLKNGIIYRIVGMHVQLQYELYVQRKESRKVCRG